MTGNRPKEQAKEPTPEEAWIRNFVGFYGTGNLTRFFSARLNNVSLTRVVEALFSGSAISSEKCEGPGCICTFRHDGEDDTVEVDVFFDSGDMELEIRRSTIIRQETKTVNEENGSEPNAA